MMDPKVYSRMNAYFPCRNMIMENYSSSTWISLN
uniref:Uncharacterized protein n=1 Tax=Rhizophora mucronata TaxID=61149 RepID=A0A2P2QWA1_RHIMU